MSVAVNGVERINKKIAGIALAIDEKVKRAMIDSGLLVIRRSIDYTPKDTGNLRGSTKIDFDFKRSIKRVRILNTASYAAAAHERMEATNWTEPGTGPKFFERALLESEGDIIKKIKDAVKL